MSESNPYAAPAAPLEDETTSAPRRPLASPGSRLLARLVDAIVLGVMMVVIHRVFVWADAAPPTFPKGTPAWQMLASPERALQAICAQLVEAAFVLRRGQSLGKIAMNIRIETSDGRLPGLFRGVVLRQLVFAPLAFIPVVGPFLSTADHLRLLREDGKAFHDLLAGTRVVELPKRGTASTA